MAAAQQKPVAEVPAPEQPHVALSSAAVELAPMPESVPQPAIPAPLPVPEQVSESQVPEPDVATQKPVPVQPGASVAETQDVSKAKDVDPPRSATKMIIGVALGVVLLLAGGGGYWFMSHEKFSEQNPSAATSAPSLAVPTPPAAVTQPAASEVPKAEAAAPSPAIAAAPMTTASTSATPAVAAQTPATTTPVKPKTDAVPTKTAVAKKKSAEKPTQEVVQTVPSQPVVSAPPVVVEPPSPPKSVARTLDEQFSSRVAAECAKDLTWVFCREKVRFSVCDGKWSENPPVGQLVCKGAATTNKNAN